MTNEEFKTKISERLPEATFDESGEFLNIIVPSEQLLPLMQELREKDEYLFDYLFCLTCIDWIDHLMMVYFLNSTTHKHNIVIKGKITDTTNPSIETVCHIWKTAELLEREVFDLFGVSFKNHPDLRRLFLEEDWVGYPLRKNYIDEHMIEL